jgi:hypothetical protein
MTYKMNQEFWNKLAQIYPGEIADLRKWIDEYKKKVDWNDLFWNAGQTRVAYWGDIKFHHLPDPMQAGLFIQYIVETNKTPLLFDTEQMHDGGWMYSDIIEAWFDQDKPGWIPVNDDKKPEGGKSVLVLWNESPREAYYNAGFKTWHVRSTMPSEQEDVQIFPSHWRSMPR